LEARKHVNDEQIMEPISDAGYAGKRHIPPFDPHWGFFLDVDGTLVEFSERPDKVRIDAALQSILRRLVDAAAGAVALISGRSIADIDRMFTPLLLPVAGQHGLERRNADGRIYVRATATARLHAAAEKLEQLTARYPDLKFENKGTTLALHYRRAPSLAHYADEIMRELLASLGDGFELLAGNMVFEIKPGGFDKGTAIAAFLEEPPFHGRVPVFIGDDVTDEFGFSLVNNLRGHAVKVGAGASSARWRLADAKAVRAWLTAFAERYAAAPVPRQP
jgi:trehalose 6-phosphate phosphatase